MMDGNNYAYLFVHMVSIWMRRMTVMTKHKKFAGTARRVFVTSSFCLFLALLSCSVSGQSAAKQPPSDPPRPGVKKPGVRHSMSEVHPLATFNVEGSPDWMVVTEGAVWVTSSSASHVVRLDAKTNQPGVVVTVNKPCSGLASGFGSVWVPSCGSHRLIRLDDQTGKMQAEISVAPADSEGGITTGAGSIWMASDKKGILSRVDPQANKVVAEITIPSGSFAPAFADGAVWITSTEHDLLTRVDPESNKVTASIPVGPKPRFLTAGADSIWTLNQGAGTISRVDTKTNKLIKNIDVGIPGTGGEIAFGEGSVWATVFEIPISRIDPATNTVVAQWRGPGGDSIRVGHGSVWLTDIAHGKVWRLDPKHP